MHQVFLIDCYGKLNRHTNVLGIPFNDLFRFLDKAVIPVEGGGLEMGFAALGLLSSRQQTLSYSPVREPYGGLGFTAMPAALNQVPGQNGGLVQANHLNTEIMPPL